MKIKTLFYFSLFVLLILISGCSSRSEKKGMKIASSLPKVINWTDFLNTPNKITKLSSISESISYITLDSPDSIKMGIVFLTSITDTNIFILDQTLSLFVFDNNGTFINKINQLGRGPGEYQSLKGFTIDEQNKQVIFHSDRELLIYNFKGEFVKSIDIPSIEYPVSTEWLGNDLYIVMMNVAETINDNKEAISTIVIDMDGLAIVKHPYYINEKRPEIWSSLLGTLTKTKDGMLVKEPYNDTVFVVNNQGEKTPFIINNLGELRAPRDYLDSPVGSRDKNANYIIKYSSQLFNDYSFVSFTYKNQVHSGIWDFSKKKAISVLEPNNGMEDDIDFGLPFVTPQKSCNNLIDIIEPIKLLSNKSVRPREGSELAEIMKNLTINDNPIIRILNTKPDIKPE